MSKNKNNKKKNAHRKGIAANCKSWASNPIFTGELARILQQQLDDGDVPEGLLHVSVKTGQGVMHLSTAVDVPSYGSLKSEVMEHAQKYLLPWHALQIWATVALLLNEVELPREESETVRVVDYVKVIQALAELLPLVRGMGAFLVTHVTGHASFLLLPEGGVARQLLHSSLLPCDLTDDKYQVHDATLAALATFADIGD